jgi:hypothetical protein
MFVSILQRFVFWVSQGAGEPLQSRADQNTRKTESGGQSGSKPAKKRVEDRVLAVFRTGKRQTRQTNQEIWQQLGLDCCTAAVWPGSRRRGPRAVPRLLSRGDTL